MMILFTKIAYFNASPHFIVQPDLIFIWLYFQLEYLLLFRGLLGGWVWREGLWLCHWHLVIMLLICWCWRSGQVNDAIKERGSASRPLFRRHKNGSLGSLLNRPHWMATMNENWMKPLGPPVGHLLIGFIFSSVVSFSHPYFFICWFVVGQSFFFYWFN